jgi:regulator of protease activity HflC (stomatin/prohibitin superfamily)
MGETFLTKLIEWLWDVAERYIFFWVIVRDYEAGVVLLLGKYHYTLKKGINWKFPLIHESLTCLIKPETIEVKPFTVNIKNNTIISIGLVGCYEVYDEKKFLIEANDAATNIYHHFIAEASDHITDCTFETLVEKTTPFTDIKRKLNKKLEYCGARFTMINYSSMCKVRPISLINS